MPRSFHLNLKSTEHDSEPTDNSDAHTQIKNRVSIHTTHIHVIHIHTAATHVSIIFITHHTSMYVSRNDNAIQKKT